MPDLTLEILIKTLSDKYGADQIHAVLNQTASVSKDTSEKIGEHFLGTREKAHLLHFGLRELGGSFPELGMLSRLLFNPMTAGFAASALALEAYFKWQEKIEAKYHDMVVSAQKVNDQIKDIVKAGGSEAEALVAATKAMAELEVHSQGMAHQIAEAKSQSEQFAEVMKGLDENKRTADEDATKTLTDRISLLEALGKMTKEQADQAKLQAEHEGKLTQMADKRQAAEDAVTAARSERNTLAGRMDLSGGGDAARQQALEDAKFKAARDAALIEKGPGAIADIDQKIQAAADEAARAGAGSARAKQMEAYGQSLADQRQSLITQTEEAKAGLANDEKALATAQDNIKAAAELRTSLESVDAKLLDLNNKLELLSRGQASEKGAAEQQYLLSSLTQLIKDTGKQPSEIANTTSGMQELLTATGFSNSQTANILKALVDGHASHQQVLTEIMRRIQVLTTQSQNTNFTNK